MAKAHLYVTASFLVNGTEDAGVVIADGGYERILTADEAEQLAAMIGRSAATVRELCAAVAANPDARTMIAIRAVGTA